MEKQSLLSKFYKEKLFNLQVIFGGSDSPDHDKIKQQTKKEKGDQH